MKRDDALITLSHDHQHGLATALTLRRATRAETGAARAAFLEFWRAEGSAHFRIEEEVLLPGFARHGDVRIDAVARVLLDHVELRSRAVAIEGDSDPPLELLNSTGELLAEHIRHEERVLFPLIEQTLPQEDLARLGAALAAAHE
jgi:hemerythrin-like domain-containing protein